MEMEKFNVSVILPINSSANDEEIMPYIDAANVACGFHASDPTTMRNTVILAKKFNVKVGAHPAYPDLAGFGRRPMMMQRNEIKNMVMYQVGALKSFLDEFDVPLNHIKPHGALYNMAAKDFKLAKSIAEAIYNLDPSLTLFGLSQSELTRAGEETGLQVAHEVFADRTYQSDGSLTPRSLPGSVLHDEVEVEKQVLRMVNKQEVVSTEGKIISLQADTVCLHGDNDAALNLAKRLYNKLS